MTLSRTAEWIGIATAIGLWAASLPMIAPSTASENGARAATASMVDPMFVRDDARAAVPVSGRVVDGDGRPVPGARVFVYHQLSDRAATTDAGYLTDAAGRFHICGLRPGQYSFVAVHDGYPMGATDEVLVFADDGDSDVEISLDQEPVDA